ncbi:Restriction of telomere capping protein 5 [Lunasporangiospora selenospora]|uniref:Restriction of telomere capping protein 5 n=1 Tax=Lunasporangiospora selenospora TaxID=979761 RepID=A0A9P6KGN8_9FUNG|nr:Restriction of telomere capping protein 5 [Lunasporangiospora selenospora]
MGGTQSKTGTSAIGGHHSNGHGDALSPKAQHALGRGPSVDTLGHSWASNKLQKELAAKFTELELLSLRQVLQKLVEEQDKLLQEEIEQLHTHTEQSGASSSAQSTTTGSTAASGASPSPPMLSPDMKKARKDALKRAPGITESCFVRYIGIPKGECHAGQLLFRSFCNLSVYPDNPEDLPNRRDEGTPTCLTIRDFIKPLAIYCQKVSETTHVDIKPLKVIFESFADRTPAPRPASPLSQDAARSPGLPINKAITSDNIRSAGDYNDAGAGEVLKKSQTMDEPIKDMPLEISFDWDPENDDEFVEKGPKVEAQDLVEVLTGLFWLNQKLLRDGQGSSRASDAVDILQRTFSNSDKDDDKSSARKISDRNGRGSKTDWCRKRAVATVEQIVQYSRPQSQAAAPVDLSQEKIDYTMFSKYIFRNAPNVLELLSPYFYRLFLIGTTMTGTTAARASVLTSVTKTIASGTGIAAEIGSGRRPGGSVRVGAGMLDGLQGSRSTSSLVGISPLPEMNAASAILTPETLTLVSWFLPSPKVRVLTPTMTSLYCGSIHGFSMNQFEVHVCKYPAPTLFLLLVEKISSTETPTTTIGRRKSISFATTKHRKSMSSNGSLSASNHSPTYPVPWNVDTRRQSIEKTSITTPATPVSGGLLTTTTSTTLTEETHLSAEPTELPQEPATVQSNSKEAVTAKKTKRRERMILGAYVNETWKVSKSGWGNDSFAIFELSPCFEVFPARKSNTSTSSVPGSAKTPTSVGGSRSYYSPQATSPRGAAADPFSRSSNTGGGNASNRHFIHFHKNAGVGFGGHESDSCMLYMDDNLQYGTYRQDFAGGNVYQSAGGARQQGFEVEFEIIDCEVWGLGGPEAKVRQQREWDFEQREANKRASIHLRGAGEQDIDRDILEMAGVLDPDRGHRHARRQSVV